MAESAIASASAPPEAEEPERHQGAGAGDGRVAGNGVIVLDWVFRYADGVECGRDGKDGARRIAPIVLQIDCNPDQEFSAICGGNWQQTWARFWERVVPRLPRARIVHNFFVPPTVWLTRTGSRMV
jgi:hypothetical protein